MSITRHTTRTQARSLGTLLEGPMLALLLALSVVPRAGATGAVSMQRMWATTLHRGAGRSIDSLVCDLDGDGAPDVLLSERGRRGPWWTIALRGSTGDELWRREYGERPLIQVACSPEGAAMVVAVTGRLLEMVDGATGATVRSAELASEAGRLALGRLDADACPDVVCAVGPERDDSLLALSGANLAVLWRLDAEPDGSRYGCGFGHMVCADADGDGLEEIFAVENTDALVRINGRGIRQWSRSLGERTALFPKGAATSAPLVDDLTMDGRCEVAVGCLAGGLVVIDAAGGDPVCELQFGVGAHEGAARRRGLPRFMRELLAESGEPVNELLALELDGRPGRELVFGCSDGFVYAASLRSSEMLWRFDTEGQVYDRPLGLDLSGDGVADVIAWDSKRAYLLDGKAGRVLDGLPSLTAPAGLHASDLTGDGLLEIVAVTYEPATVTAWTTDVVCGRHGGPEPSGKR